MPTPAPAAPAAPAASPAPVKDLTPAPAAPAASATPAAAIPPSGVDTSALAPAAQPGAPAAPSGPVGNWPEDWREQIYGQDPKLLARLQRYGSVKDVANALVAAQNRISSGELKSSLKPNATADEATAWRAENGIPESPDKYDLAMPNGIVFGEDDKPFLESFTKAAHAANFHPDQVKAALSWYHQDREAQIEAMAARDAQQRDATRDELVAEWGVNDFKRNSQMIMGLLDTAPAGIKDILLSARGADEQALFNNPNVLRFFDSLARQINPVATVVPGATGNIGAAIGDEIAKLEKQMGSKSSEYWKGPNAAKNQARYRELVGARERMGAKAA